MPRNIENYLNMVRQILLQRLSPYNAKLLLFGSMARGDFWRASDIDVAVLPDKKLPVGLLSELREQLEDSNIPYRVELVDLSTVSKNFAKRVMETGISRSD
jgi:predicted nucleotidyltransferase